MQKQRRIGSSLMGRSLCSITWLWHSSDQTGNGHDKMTMLKENKIKGHEPKRTSLIKIFEDPWYILELLASIVEDILHIHGGNNDIRSSSKVINQRRPLLLPDMLWEPRNHPSEVHPGPQLHGSKSNTISLPDPYHHHSHMVFHHDDLSEASHLCLMAGGHQLLLQCW